MVAIKQTSCRDAQHGYELIPDYHRDKYKKEKFNSFHDRVVAAATALRNFKTMCAGLLEPDFASRLATAPEREQKVPLFHQVCQQNTDVD